MEFDFGAIVEDRTEFVTVTGRGKTPDLHSIIVDLGVQGALIRAADNTYQAMRQEAESSPLSYDPGNSYASTGFLIVPMNGEFSSKAEYLHTYPTPPPLPNPAKKLQRISLYIARLEDEHGRLLSAVKTTSDFGGTLKRTVSSYLSNGELKLDTKPVFELKNDFDFFIEDEAIWVYRHKAFEAVCNLERAIRDSVETNINLISQQSACVDFSTILDPASKSIRSARALASIRANDYGRNLDPGRVKHYCAELGITVAEVEGKIQVAGECHLTFLRLIARQILGVELRAGFPERFVALNRQAM